MTGWDGEDGCEIYSLGKCRQTREELKNADYTQDKIFTSAAMANAPVMTTGAGGIMRFSTDVCLTDLIQKLYRVCQ